MTSRERVLKAIAHQETDRVPIDFDGMRSTGIMAIAYNKLKAHLGMSHDTLQYDVVQGLAMPDDEMLDRFGVDVINLGRPWHLAPSYWKPWTLCDGSEAKVPTWFDPEPDGDGGWIVRGDEGQVIGVMPRTQEYVTQTYWPLADDAHGLSEAALSELPRHMQQVTWARLGCPPWHPGADDSRWAEMREEAVKLRESTDRAIMAPFGGNLVEWAQFLRGFGRFLLDLAERPRDAHRLLDALTELHLQGLDKFLDAVGDSADIIRMGDDLGTQHGPQMSPGMYREFFLPRHQRIYSRVKERSELKVFLHCCGGVYELIPSLIEAGVEILNPVQTSAVNMEPERLKREFGKDLTFWGGGCETQSTLAHGSPEDVRREVEQRIAIFGRGGGYVFNQVHNVLSDVPPENVVAMFEAAMSAELR